MSWHNGNWNKTKSLRLPWVLRRHHQLVRVAETTVDGAGLLLGQDDHTMREDWKEIHETGSEAVGVVDQEVVDTKVDVMGP